MRLVERYILGSEVLTISDQEPTAGQVEGGGPPNYAAFPYPLESEGWPTNYPVPEPPTLEKLYLLPEKARAAEKGLRFTVFRQFSEVFFHHFHHFFFVFLLRFALFSSIWLLRARQPAMAVAPLLLWEAPRCREKRFL